MGEQKPERAKHAQEVKSYLRRMTHAKDLLQDLIQERDGLREIAGFIGSPGFDERVQTSQGNEAAFVRKLDCVFEIEERLNSEIERISDISIKISAGIEKLPSIEERLVLRYRYLGDLPWDAIAAKMNVSVRTVHRLHSAALAHFEIPDEDR